MKRATRRMVCLGLLGLLSVTASFADWLVTRAGDRIETRGEWRVDGRQVLFTLPNGTLSALRVTEVDLEASRAATEEVNRPNEAEAEAADEPRPEPVLVLTNQDIPQAADPESGDSEIGADEEGAAFSGPGLRVIDWSVEPGNGGVRVVGRLENGADRMHSGVRLRLEVRNDEGEILATSTATVIRETLIAGGVTTFEARFPGYSELPGQPTFKIDSRELRRTREAADDAADEAPGPEDDEFEDDESEDGGTSR